MVPAFKEWAKVVEALGTGKQVVVLRKGGISEDFTLQFKKFLLFPTQFHEQENLVKDDWLAESREDDGWKGPHEVEMRYFATLEDAFMVDSWEKVQALDKFHVWKEPVVKERFERWQQGGVHCLLLRAYRLKKPFLMEVLPEYGGCRSWIETQESIPLDGIPAMEDDAFEGLRNAIKEALQ